MKHRLPALLAAAAAIAAGVTGCGSADRQDVQATLAPQAVVDQYRDAILDGDGGTACSLLSDVAKNDVESDGSQCTARLSEIAEQNTAADTRAFKAMHPQVAVHGIRAVARFQTLGRDPTRIALENEGTAGWKITDSPELENVRIANR